MTATAHRIQSIEITHHRLNYDPPFHASWDTKPRVFFDATIVRITTDTGLVGVGSGAAGVDASVAGFAASGAGRT